MRICSLLPGATEVVFALGLGDQIVGVTHECDYPAEAKQKTVVVRSAIDSHRLSGHEIDRKVSELLEAGKGLYLIDEEALRASAPELIVTQGLCDVCALDYNEVVKAAAALAHAPAILSLNPHSLADVMDDVVRIGAATNSAPAADAFVSELRQRVEQIGLGEPDYRPRVVCLEWFEPLYAAGHWVPEMVALAGGHDVLGRAGEPSFRIDWSSVLDAQPEIILLMPCGFDVRRAVKEASALRKLPRWDELQAVQREHVYAQRQRLFQPARSALGERVGNSGQDHPPRNDYVVHSFHRCSHNSLSLCSHLVQHSLYIYLCLVHLDT